MIQINRETSPNRTYLALALCTLAQIQPYGWTSDTLVTLGDISLGGRCKDG